MSSTGRSAVALAALAGSVIAAALVYTMRIAPHWLRVTRLNVRVPALPEELDGLRVSHLSDFHMGAPGMKTGHLHHARRIALDFDPDIVALTGDFYDMGTDVDSEGLFANWPEGLPVWAVLGNHDRRVEGSLERTILELKAAGVQVLVNESRPVTLRGRQVWISGIDDAHTFSADVERTFCSLPDGETALLVLSHAPAPITDMQPGMGRMMLAGHTHGGQVRLLPSGAVPFVDLIRKVRGAVPRPDGPVYRGWHWINGTILIVSEGLGISTLPVRFRTRPQLILIELQRAPEHAERACDDVHRYVDELDPEPWLIRWLT